MEELVSLVRYGQASLWIGSGVSIASGLPSATEIAESLGQQLHDKRGVGESLSEVSDAFVSQRGGSKADLMMTMRKLLHNNDINLETHRLITMIPQITEIVTTNYDDLIERAYADLPHNVVSTDRELAIADRSIPTIYKIHGDLRNPDGIILTRSDYEKWYSQENDPLWLKVKTMLLQGSVIFLGYSMRDENIRDVFRFINDKMGDFARQHYVVAPNWTESDIESLPSKLVYLDATAKDFLVDLKRSIEEHLLTDLLDGILPFERAKRLLEDRDLSARLSIDDRVRSLSLSTTLADDSDDPVGSVSLRADPDPEVVAELNALASGKAFGPVELPEEAKPHVTAEIRGLPVFPSRRQSEFRSVTLSPVPKVYGVADLEIEASDEVLRKVDYTVYSGRAAARFEFTYDIYHVVVEYQTDTMSVKFEYRTEPGKRHSVRQALTFLTFLQHWIDGALVTLIPEDGEGSLLPPLNASTDKDSNDQIQQLLEMFSDIQFIQRSMRVSFGRINLPDEEEIYLISLLGQIFRTGRLSIDGSIELNIHLDPSVPSIDSLSAGEPKAFMVESQRDYTVSLFGKELNLGRYRVLCLNAVLADPDQIESGVQDSVREISIRIRPTSKPFYVAFDRFPLSM